MKIRSFDRKWNEEKKFSFNESKSFLGECMEWFWVYYKGDNLVVLL